MKDLSVMVVGEPQMTGPNELDIKFVLKSWTKMWRIFENIPYQKIEAEYRLCVGVRNNSENSRFKSTITKEQAIEIIKAKKLEPTTMFSTTVWRSHE